MPHDLHKQFHHMLGDGLSVPHGYDDVSDMTSGDDHARGGNGADVFYCYDGNDYVRDNHGPDTIYGMGGNDTLRGGKAPDLIDGGIGDDRINSGGAGDNLWGGDGADTFLYRKFNASTSDGSDTMNDFQSGIDHIVLKGEFRDVTADQIHIVDDGFGGCTVTIDGLDFLIVSKTIIAVGDFV